jgi:DNA-binding CsgD family transcriptional regulator
MSGTRKLSNRKLKSLSDALLNLYRPVAPSELPRQIVNSVEAFFRAEVVAYHEFRDGAAPFVLSNIGLERSKRVTDAFARLMMQNPLVVQLMTQKSLPGARLTDVLPAHELRRTDLYNEVYKPLEADYQIACGFSGGKDGSVVALAINQKLRDFTDEELYLFNVIIPHAQQAYQICHALDAARGGMGVISGALEGAGTGLIVFDNAFRVVSITGTGLRLAWMLFGARPCEGCILPGELLDCVLQLKRRSEPEMPAPPTSLNYEREDGSNLRLRLSFDPERGHHCLILELESGPPTVARLMTCGLSHREAEVAQGILARRTHEEIGAGLGVSARTVEKHAVKIFARLGVLDRNDLERRVGEMLCGSVRGVCP